YGKHLNCPPHVPSPEDTRKQILCYEHAIVARFDAEPNREVPPSQVHHFLWDAIKAMYDTMFELERHAIPNRVLQSVHNGWALLCILQ
ncbi:putative metal-binding protein, partial [Methanophagales archaeon]